MRRVRREFRGFCAGAIIALPFYFPCVAGSEEWMNILRAPFWSSNSMRGEALFFIRESEDEPPKAKLLFAPVGQVRIVHPASGRAFEEGKDYHVVPAANTITLTDGSPI